jgi:hypothetical protein
MDRKLITSVLGFNLKAEIKNQDGSLLPEGIKKTIIPKTRVKRIKVRLCDKTFFTSFNESLLEKVIMHRKLTQ